MNKTRQAPSARRIIGMVVGVIIIALGIAPYDYLSLGLRDHTPFPYFGCRVFTDALCALLCWLLGGLVGIGTLVCAFCLGPFIQFFDGHFSQKVLKYKPVKE